MEPGLIGKVFYELDPSGRTSLNSKSGWNGFANKMVLQYSNAGAYIIGTPPDGMPAMNPRLEFNSDNAE